MQFLREKEKEQRRREREKDRQIDNYLNICYYSVKTAGILRLSVITFNSSDRIDSLILISNSDFNKRGKSLFKDLFLRVFNLFVFLSVCFFYFRRIYQKHFIEMFLSSVSYIQSFNLPRKSSLIIYISEIINNHNEYYDNFMIQYYLPL